MSKKKENLEHREEKKKAVVLVFIRIYKMKCFHSLRASVEKDDDL